MENRLFRFYFNIVFKFVDIFNSLNFLCLEWEWRHNFKKTETYNIEAWIYIAAIQSVYILLEHIVSGNAIKQHKTITEGAEPKLPEGPHFHDLTVCQERLGDIPGHIPIRNT